MTDNPTKLAYWRGVPVEKMTRADLIEALDYYTAEYFRTHTPENMHAMASAKAKRFVAGR